MQIDLMSRTPVYEQIIEQIERFILTGAMKSGEQLPSVRALSTELSINPNTIVKAYNELDQSGIIFSVPGKGNYIADDGAEKLLEKRRLKLEDLKRSIGELAIAGISKEEINLCVDAAFETAEKIRREK